MTAGKWFDPIGQEWRPAAFLFGREERLKEAERKRLLAQKEIDEGPRRTLVEIPNSLAGVETGDYFVTNVTGKSFELSTEPTLQSLDIHPTSPGVYVIRTKKKGGYFDGDYSYFDGCHWNGVWSSKERAERKAQFFKECGNEGAASNYRDDLLWTYLSHAYFLTLQGTSLPIDKDGWIPHSGGPMPCPGDWRVQVKTKENRVPWECGAGALQDSPNWWEWERVAGQSITSWRRVPE